MISNQLQSFIQKNQDQLLKKFDINNCKCQILSSSKEDLQQAAQLIKDGKLVAFPTETVYGLGANALDPEAVKAIYHTKRRPFTDPVIVHVTTMEMALNLVKINDQIHKIFLALAETFWPGPLTFILPANFDTIDRVITAQTDYIGIRMPSNDIARQLINLSGKPIAAPSANLFSHVSPTNPVHVFNDFYDQNIHIIDEKECQFGIESTVIKIQDEKIIQILRHGSISDKQLITIIKQKLGNDMMIETIEKKSNIDENQQAPGQLLKHYSPMIESFLFEVSEEGINHIKNIQIENCIILDFSKECEFLKEKCLKYQLLSEKNDLQEVMNKLYNLLRWAENVENALYIMIYDIKSFYKKNNQDNPEFLETVFDKIFRCTEGKKIFINNQLQFFSD